MTSRPDLGELQALARAVALDGALEVIAGAPGTGWFIRIEDGVISADGADLDVVDPDELRGLVCHEAAHAAVTRYDHLVPHSLLRDTPGLASLLNALEDCRIEAWLARRLPGTAPWIERYNDRLFPVDGGALGRLPHFQQFCLGAIHEWWHGQLPAGLAEPVVVALDTTRAARRALVDAQPPLEPRVDGAEVQTYRTHPVARLFRRSDAGLAPDPFERAVRLAAYAAWHVTWHQVRPVYDELVRRDQEHFRDLARLEQRFLAQLSGIGRPIRRRRARRPGAAMSLPGSSAARPDTTVPEPASRTLPELDAEARRRLEAAADPDTADVWGAALQAVAGLAEPMVAELERVLTLDAFPRWVAGWPSGSRLDLRAAMQLEADRSGIGRLWQRKTVPHKHDPAFVLLLDLSGSMAGAPMEHGFRGVVLLSEVLARLGVPFAVHGFQDVLVPLKAFDAPLDGPMRARLGTMPAEVEGRRPGGRNRPEHNHDGPVLARAAELLAHRPADHRVLIVVSDGIPSGPGDGEAALRDAIGEIRAAGAVHLVGVGLGPGTGHVARYYPEHLANVPLTAFPGALGRAIEAHLTRGRPAGAPRR